MQILTILFIVLHLIAKIEQTPFLWGFDSFSYFNDIIAFLLVIISASVLLPGVQNKLKNYVKVILSYFEKVPFYIWPIIFGVIAYIFRQKGYLLGDGTLRIKELEEGRFFSGVEPLDTYIHAVFYKYFHGMFRLTGADVYSIISILSGMAAFFGVIYYLKKIFENKNDRWFISGLLLTCGAVQLFFGYAESYSIIAALNLLVILSSMAMLKNNKFSIVPAIYFSLAVISHPISILFAPALLYSYIKVLNFREDLKKSIFQIFIPLIIFIIIFAGLLTIFAIGGYTPAAFFKHLLGENHIAPLFSNKVSNGIFSFEHLIDLINQFALATPVIIALPFAFKNFRNKLNPQSIFLLIASFFAVLFMVIFKTDLGFSRDWDIFSLFAFPFTMTIGYLIVNKNEPHLEGGVHLNQAGGLTFRIAITVILISLINTGTWIYLNSSEELSMKRAESLVETPYWSNHSRAILYDELNQYYFKKNDMLKAYDNIQKAYNFENKDRYYYSLGVISYKLKKIDSAILIFKELAKNKYKTEVDYMILGELYNSKGEFKEAAYSYSELVKLTPSNPTAYYNLGISYYNSKNVDSSMIYFNKMLRLSPDNKDALNYVAQICYENYKLDEAIGAYKRLINLDNYNPAYHYNIALCYSDKGDYISALKYVESARQRGFDIKGINELKAEILRAMKK